MTTDVSVREPDPPLAHCVLFHKNSFNSSDSILCIYSQGSPNAFCIRNKYNNNNNNNNTFYFYSTFHAKQCNSKCLTAKYAQYAEPLFQRGDAMFYLHSKPLLIGESFEAKGVKSSTVSLPYIFGWVFIYFHLLSFIHLWRKNILSKAFSVPMTISMHASAHTSSVQVGALDCSNTGNNRRGNSLKECCTIWCLVYAKGHNVCVCFST